MKLASIFLALALNTPEGYQQYAFKYIEKHERPCIKELWRLESNWRPEAKSPTHDYGIPQRHMKHNTKKQIAKFRSDPLKQIDWGIGYVRHRYNDFCTALDHHRARGWY